GRRAGRRNPARAWRPARPAGSSRLAARTGPARAPGDGGELSLDAVPAGQALRAHAGRRRYRTEMMNAAEPTSAGHASGAVPRAVAGGRSRVVNAMSVDVEDYYQVSAFAGTITRADWPNYPSRVERNTDRILELFAEAKV